MTSGTSLLKVQLPGTELHYVERGVGNPVILVHGGFGDYRQWGHLQEVLSNRFRAISYSRRGAYPNRSSLGGRSGVPEHSADLASLITLISKTPVHLVGESYGAFVAAHCAIEYPEKVKSLSIDEPPMLPLLRDNDVDKAALLLFENDVLKPTTACFKTGFDYISIQDVRELKTPTLLLKSELGPRLLRRIVDILHEAIPNAILKEIRGASHGTIIDSPEYSSSVMEFILTESGN